MSPVLTTSRASVVNLWLSWLTWTRPVLVHAQVHKGAKGRHVADRAFQDHAGLQVADVLHALVEARHLEVRARVAAGLFQLAQDVFHRDDAELLVGKQLGRSVLSISARPISSATGLAVWAMIFSTTG